MSLNTVVPPKTTVKMKSGHAPAADVALVRNAETLIIIVLIVALLEQLRGARVLTVSTLVMF
jgi:hypothetical protein